MKINGCLVPNDLIRYGGHMSDRISSSYKDDILFIQVVNFNDKKNDTVNDNNDLDKNNNNNSSVIDSVEINEIKVLSENIVCEKRRCKCINPFENDDIVAENDIDSSTSDEFDQVIEIAHLYSDNEDERFKNDVREIVDKIEILNNSEKDILYTILCKFKKLFSEKEDPGGRYEHEIKLKSQNAVVKKSYPVPTALRPAVDKKIQEMLEKKVLERSTSSYCSPLRIVVKKDGDVRVCLDA